MHRGIGVVATLSVGVLTSVLAATPAAAAPHDFYSAPNSVSEYSNGDVLRNEPSQLALSVPTTGGTFPAEATRIMYRTEDANGSPNAVTGTYLEPANEWTGPGERPLVAAAAGTQGQGDQCAPSKLLNTAIDYQAPLGLMTEYEVLWIDMLLSQGIAVVLTDYDGLGTEGDHTYVNRAAEAHALLDAARAAQNLENTSIADDGPVGLWGYSQGGGAAAAAAELQPQYAPELDLKGTYAGAPPADLAATLEQVDGTFLTGVIGYAINGLVEAYPELGPDIDGELNQQGRDMLNAVKDMCVPETGARFGFQQTSSFTKTGEPLSVVLGRLPAVQQALDEQRIGRLTPTSPVLIQHGANDDIVPFGQGRQLAVDWCDKGAEVQFSADGTPPVLSTTALNHLTPYVLGAPESVNYMLDRFRDVPAPSNCGAF